MNNKNKLLFQEFNPVSKEEWLEKVSVDLKGIDFDKKLVWKNLNNINIQPFYNSEDRITQLQNTGENSQSLVNYRNIDVCCAESGNKLAKKAIEEGMNGLIFSLEGNIAVSELLNGINLNESTVSFDLKSNEVKFISNFIHFVKENNFTDLKGFINTGIISEYLTTAKLDESKIETAIELVKLTADYRDFKAITVSGTEYLDSGSNQVQEIAYTLNSLVYLLDELTKKGTDTQTIFNNLNFNLAIGLEYFVEIGKFRAFRSLLSEIATKYDISDIECTINSKTSIWSKSIIDPETNLLRSTTEAMSAILGNVDSILVDAYDNEFNETSDFSSRIAGNIATILKEESYFGKVLNPVDGSYYIEEVSFKIAEKALELFKSIEEIGGFYAAFENETIQQQIGEIRLKKLKLISQRRLPLVGVNKYPNLMETVSADVLSKNTSLSSKALSPRRASLEIEALRKSTEEFVAKTGKRPIVELASFGNLNMRKARAAFAYDFLGVSGYDVQQEKTFPTSFVAAEKSSKSDSNVVVICSSDEDYDIHAITFIRAFRALNKDKVLLIAGAPKNLNELTEIGLDGCVNIKSDIITTISNIQGKIQKINKILSV